MISEITENVFVTGSAVSHRCLRSRLPQLAKIWLCLNTDSDQNLIQPHHPHIISSCAPSLQSTDASSIHYNTNLQPMYPGSVINHPCTVCYRATSMWCSRCQNAWYCSAEHLQSDWPRHRRECVATSTQHAQVAQFNTIATPPAQQANITNVTAIYFAAEDERPRIVNISCRPLAVPTPSNCPTPLVHSFFQEGQPNSVVLTQGLNGEPLRFPLHLWYCPVSLARGSPVNRAIYRITSGAAPKAWSGPVVVLKFNGSRRQGYSDAGSNDLPALSAYFLDFK